MGARLAVAPVCLISVGRPPPGDLTNTFASSLVVLANSAPSLQLFACIPFRLTALIHLFRGVRGTAGEGESALLPVVAGRSNGGIGRCLCHGVFVQHHRRRFRLPWTMDGDVLRGGRIVSWDTFHGRALYCYRAAPYFSFAAFRSPAMFRRVPAVNCCICFYFFSLKQGGPPLPRVTGSCFPTRTAVTAAGSLKLCASAPI